MNEQDLFKALLVGCLASAPIISAVLLFVAAPYGRHARRGWGPTLNNRLAWILMEAPAPLLFAVLFLVGEYRVTLAAWVFLFMWEAHYLHRAFVYPLGLRTTGKRMPVLITGFGILFNVLNTYLNGRHVFTFSGGYPADWLKDPRFVGGAALFLLGYVVNRRADHTLRRLRQEGASGYTIPSGGLYRWVSCPNYFGEILVWSGWAIATWSMAGLAFAVWTAANLAPRARSHHQWYHEQFADYPEERKALLPGVW